jgi:hypothetical protein
MMRSKRGALLFAASLNLSSKVLSSFSINVVGKFIFEKQDNIRIKKILSLIADYPI